MVVPSSLTSLRSSHDLGKKVNVELDSRGGGGVSGAPPRRETRNKTWMNKACLSSIATTACSVPPLATHPELWSKTARAAKELASSSRPVCLIHRRSTSASFTVPHFHRALELAQRDRCWLQSLDVSIRSSVPAVFDRAIRPCSLPWPPSPLWYISPRRVTTGTNCYAYGQYLSRRLFIGAIGIGLCLGHGQNLVVG
jgi:hypothetical protein